MSETRNGGDGDDGTTTLSLESSWRGCSLQEIYRNLNEFELDHVPPIKVSANHTVLYHCPIGNIPDDEPPRPLRAQPKWDATHVRLPCSPKSQYPVTQPDGTSTIESRWEMIEKALLRPIQNSRELQDAILSYNSKYKDIWNFKALHTLFEEHLDESEAEAFFDNLLPRIIRLALQLPQLVQAPIPLLKQKQNHSLTLSQQQISSLLANAFLCTFPRRNTLKRKSEYSAFPDINFNRLFSSSGQATLEKIKCICHYFRRICPTEKDRSNIPSGVVTFSRRSFAPPKLPDWETCIIPLGVTPLHITSEGTIEDQGLGLLQVDFANKFLGGGVLGHGCVQEEIRFVICPELIVSKLFTECLRPTEALLMIGCERFSDYNGYASTFQWAGDHEDCIPRDSSRRRMTNIVAIDALAFREPTQQYHEEFMLRELNKAYTGFFFEMEGPAPGVASGNWGCGAFGGEAKLKALLQIMACTAAKRPLVYFTFGDTELRDKVHRMHTFFIEKNVRVRDLWYILRKFKPKEAELYDFIYSKIENPNKDYSWKSCQTTLKRMFSLKKQSTTTEAVKPNTNNESPDIFASSPEAEAETETVSNDECPIVIESSGSNSQKILDKPVDFSDDSETDDLLLSSTQFLLNEHAANNATTNNTLNSCSNGSEKAYTNATTTTTVKTTTRQRTLVEMLDQCYTEGSPANKRHCANKRPTEN